MAIRFPAVLIVMGHHRPSHCRKRLAHVIGLLNRLMTCVVDIIVSELHYNFRRQRSAVFKRFVCRTQL